jgi:hypothetical protein
VAHYLLVIPFYFFTALATFLVLALVSRVLRLKVGANALATTAVILGIGAVAVPLALDWIDLAHLSGRQLLVIGGITFVLAALDTLLEPLLPVPFDQELSHF